MALGNQIRKLRQKQGLTLDQLSSLSGVDVGTISALENRDSKRSMFFNALAHALGTTLDQLEKENGSTEAVGYAKGRPHLQVVSPGSSAAEQENPNQYAALKTPPKDIASLLAYITDRWSKLPRNRRAAFVSNVYRYVGEISHSDNNDNLTKKPKTNRHTTGAESHQYRLGDPLALPMTEKKEAPDDASEAGE